MMGAFVLMRTRRFAGGFRPEGDRSWNFLYFLLFSIVEQSVVLIPGLPDPLLRSQHMEIFSCECNNPR